MKLVCYPVSGEPPKIRPARAARQWMEGTPNRFASRCLPLAIANAAGWEILNPVGFNAVWDGGTDLSAVTIVGEEGTPLGISHFGSGILTFHVTGLFETPKDVVLWVGGSPNHLKDGIQPLTGLVETSWSPYTFTMNWRFTRPGYPIRFEKDEPFCFFFPLSIDMIEASKPEFRSIHERPELEMNYQKWSGSRNSFNAELQVSGSAAQKEKWQKTYHRGVCPDGTKADAKHRTRVRLKPFARNLKQAD